jgi:hypothetical protein
MASMSIRKQTITGILVLLAILFPFAISLRDIASGSIPFWFDPARDLLLALNDLDKLTLIGQPTGIQGVFYGPYWIWALSLSLLISKDPRAVVFLVQALPYFTLFPWLLWKLCAPLGKHVFVLLWLLFIFSYRTYTTYLWNPHLAPLLLLALLFLVSKVQRQKKTRVLSFLSIGFLIGLIANLNMAFGVAVMLSVLLFELFFKGNKKVIFMQKVKTAGTIALGVVISFIPALIFELRHQFLQTRSMLAAFAALSGKTLQGEVMGFSIREKLGYFFTTIARLLQFKEKFTIYIYLFLLFIVIHLLRSKRLSLKKNEKILFTLVITIMASVLGVFVAAKNPVWHYHYIGVEVLFLILLGFIAGRSRMVKIFLSIWVVVLLMTNVRGLIRAFGDNPLEIPASLASRKSIVQSIYNDAGGRQFAYHAYDPAIYTYDYDYVFKWLAESEKLAEPLKESGQSGLVYLIIPQAPLDIQMDFINYKTPNEMYVTLKAWKAADGTLIMKRQRI